MVRLIFGLIIGALTFLLIMCLLLVMGLNRLSYTLEARIIKSYLQQDIHFLQDSLEAPILAIDGCLATDKLRADLQGTQVDSIENIYDFQKDLVKKVLFGVRCYHEQTNEALKRHTPQAAKTAIRSYAACLNIAARHSFLNLLPIEKQAFREAYRLYRSEKVDEQILKRVQQIMPVLEGIQNRLYLLEVGHLSDSSF